MFHDKPGWGLKVRVWVERRGEKVLGPGRVELLGHINRLHSISAAAKEMKMSYRRAWTLVKSINDAAGEALRRGHDRRFRRRRRIAHAARPRSDPLLPEPGETAGPNRR